MPESTGILHKLIADVALISGERIGLVRYARSSNYDRQTGWFLPDDELRFLEHPQDAAKRILHEQLGVTGRAPRLDHIESFQGNDRSWHLVFHFVAEISNSDVVHSGDRVSSMQWFSMDQLPERKDVAHHGWALEVIDKIMAARDISTV